MSVADETKELQIMPSPGLPRILKLKVVAGREFVAILYGRKGASPGAGMLAYASGELRGARLCREQASAFSVLWLGHCAFDIRPIDMDRIASELGVRIEDTSREAP